MGVTDWTAPETGDGWKSFLLFYCKIYGLVSSFIGIQFAYSSQFGLVAPLYNEKLHMSNSDLSIILATAGPISGFVVQPLVGAFSDQSTLSLGRRRPFILAFCILAVLGMGLLANAPEIGILLGDDANSNTASGHVWGIVLATIGLWGMDIGTNGITAPSRAIVADILPGSLQHLANSAQITMMGITGVIANLVAGLLFFSSSGYQYQFVCSIGLLALTVVISVLVGQETPLAKPTVVRTCQHKVSRPFLEVFRAISGLSKEMVLLAVMNFFSSFGFSPFISFLTAYFGQKIYGGNPTTSSGLDLYQDGIQMGLFAMAVWALAMFLFSLVMSRLIRWFSARWVWMAAQVVGGTAMICFIFTDNVYVALALTAAVGPYFACMMGIPYALLAKYQAGLDIGILVGVLNCVAVAAQVTSSLSLGQLIRLGDDEVQYAICLGGMIAVGGSFIAIGIKDKDFAQADGPRDDSFLDRQNSLLE